MPPGAVVQRQKAKKPPESVEHPKQSVPTAPPDPPAIDQIPTPAAANNNALIILISIMLLIFAAGGGLYWWLSCGEEAGKVVSTGKNSSQHTGQQNPATQQKAQTATAVPDLSQASTYLPKASLKCCFSAYYPDGTAGDIERITAQVVPSETVRVSEVEIHVQDGETVGYGFHYVERADGVYYIYDQTPMEIFPMLKNHLTVGQTWSHQDEFGQVVWTVMDMGVTLDLGFTTLQNCLLVEEDNQAVGLKKITYYAPGMGRVMIKSSTEGLEYLRLTAFSSMYAVEAANIVKKWATNYAIIHDDRTQN